MHEHFRKFAENTSKAAGSPWGFCMAVALVLLWAITGPIFGYSDTWQLIINTGTTIVTFMMVFLIQNTQNRDSLTLQLKLDELLCAMKGARSGMVDLEQLSEEELATLREQFRELAHAQSKPNGSAPTHNETVPARAPIEGSPAE
ncbi:low affinity iron permease family protein [Allopusillimonas soli]|uniref:Low affinity iron permease family protein n=1 Tax=Allopusillimonas soli TaxID=659016 RepID=A0A853FAD8_9BURK|nr:low affinity iron permease family protein [Allopusillimonas soli]NYT36947.1 low affinity iron permease family protein [Allopusillimonas soli]TEA75398.1 low affinity iron permease family protein [Allopusillimonas soli]